MTSTTGKGKAPRCNTCGNHPRSKAHSESCGPSTASAAIRKSEVGSAASSKVASPTTTSKTDYTVWQFKDANGEPVSVEVTEMGDTHLANSIKFLTKKIEALERKNEKRELHDFDAGQLTWSNGWLEAFEHEQSRREDDDITVEDRKPTGRFVRPKDIQLEGENYTKLKNTRDSLIKKRDALDQQHPLSAWDKGLLQWYREQIQRLRSEVDKRESLTRRRSGR